MKGKLLAAIACLALVSCSKPYMEPPFGGMKGRVQEVKIWHMMPEMWHAGMTESDIYYINSAMYDFQGHEIASAVMDNTERIERETENRFSGDICVQSTLKSGGKTVSRLRFLSKDGGTTRYEKTIGNASTVMTVHESSFLRRHKSTVKEDGVETQRSITVTDRNGLPKKIVSVDPKNGNTTVEKNLFDENGNIIQKVVINNGEADDTLTYQYFGFDDHGNWTEARTFNFKVLPVEVIQREIKYW